MKDINLHSVAVTTPIGGGLTKLHQLCNDLNLPQPVNENIIIIIYHTSRHNAVENYESSLRAAAHEL